MANSATYASKLIHRYAGANAATANQDPALAPTALDLPPKRDSYIRIIDWLFALSAEIDHLVALRRQIVGDVLLESETSVIGGNDYSQQQLLTVLARAWLPRWTPINPLMIHC